ncbi:ATP phosphoribosyltransferase regulatory subunit [Profundibacter sp.]
MTPKAKARTEAARLLAFFESHGAQVVETDILQSAEVLLDLYGEDIRARAYVTSDALRGEQMLRPDFTVPVVQMHMEHGAEPARYTYAGEVFRRQEEDAMRPSEFMQVGYEVFARENPAAADAEVFALFKQVLAPLGLRVATGDMGILMAAVRGLSTTDRRKAALLRHIWRPRRFRALLERYGDKAKVLPPARAALLAATDALAEAGPFNGLRSRSEVEARIAALKDDATQPPISGGEAEILDEIMSLREKAPMVLERLRDIAVDLPAITPAVEAMDARLTAMAARGVDVDGLDFEGSYGRTTLEYYDGFVFGFYAEARPDLPAVASGGRYDALSSVLGQGRSIPAVGGVIRPELVLALGDKS